jgi:hypothetical protein
MSQMAVAKILNSAKIDAQKWINQQEAIKKEEQKHEEEMFNDEKLEKILVLVD